jgi:peptide/nickel transport system substrate-binding protein
MLSGILWLGVLVAVSCTPPPEPLPEPLRIGLHAAPVSLDPHLQGEAAAFSILSNIYDTLTTFDAEMRLQPGLAIRWSNPEDRLWRLALRPDVTFHDGSGFDAEDVVFSLDRARSLPESRAAGFLVEVASVRAVGPYGVEIVTHRPYPLLPHKLALVFMVPTGSPTRIDTPVGTGPYRLVRYDPGRKVTLQAIPGSAVEGWRGRPAVERVEIWNLSDPEERVAALLAGEVEWINDVPPAVFRRLKEEGEPGVRTAARTGLRLIYLQGRPDRPPFDDPRVRRALHLALDREALVREAVAGQARPLGQMAGPEVFGHVADLEPPERDLVAVRRLLAAAGYDAATKRPTVELEHSTARNPRLIEGVQRQLTEAGFAVTPRARPWSEMYPRLYSDAVLFYAGGWVSASGDVSELLDGKVHTRDPQTGYGDANSNGYSNPPLDRLIEEAGVARDPRSRRGLLEDCMRLLMEDPAFIPLYAPFDLYAYADGLTWQPRADGNLPLHTMVWDPAARVRAGVP